MGFLFPAALGALALVALPLLLHLLRRDPVEERAFPALRYLAPEILRRKRNLHFRSWLLLALRMAAVVVVVLGAARFLVPGGAGGLPPAQVVVVLEESPVSGAVVEGLRILDAQEALVREIESGLPPLDRFHLVRAKGAVGEGGGGDAGAPSPTGARLPSLNEGIRQGARALGLRGSAPGALVVVRPDGRRLDPGWVASELHPLGVTPMEVDPGIPVPANRGIVALEVGSGLVPREGETPEVRIRVAGEGVAAEGESVRLLLDGELVAVARTGAEGWAVLALPPLPSGTILLRAEIEPDALRADDVVERTLAIRPPPRVRPRVTPGGPLATALQVLADGGRLALEAPLPVGGAAPPWEELRTDEVVVLFPPSDPALLGAFRERLAELGFQGGVGAPTAVGVGSRIQGGAALPGTLPPSLEGVGVDRRYPLEGGAAGSGAPRAGGGAPQAGVDVPQAGVDVPQAGVGLPRMEDGAPWLLSGSTAAVGVELRLMAFPLHRGWTEVVEHPAMIPLVDHLLAPARGGGAAIPGEALSPVVPVPPLGPPGSGWTRSLLPRRGGMEAAPFLAWLLFVILLAEGWLARRLSSHREEASLVSPASPGSPSPEASRARS